MQDVHPDRRCDGATPFLTAHAAHSGGAVVVTVSGELDVASAPSFRRNVLALFALPVEVVTLDLAGLTFMDSSGVNVLTRVRRVRARPRHDAHAPSGPRPCPPHPRPHRHRDALHDRVGQRHVGGHAPAQGRARSSGSTASARGRLGPRRHARRAPLTGPICGTPGTIVVSYGPDSSVEDSEVLAALPRAEQPPAPAPDG